MSTDLPAFRADHDYPPPPTWRSPRESLITHADSKAVSGDEHQFETLGTEDHEYAVAVVSPSMKTICGASSGIDKTRAFFRMGYVARRASKTYRSCQGRIRA